MDPTMEARIGALEQHRSVAEFRLGALDERCDKSDGRIEIALATLTARVERSIEELKAGLQSLRDFEQRRAGLRSAYLVVAPIFAVVLAEVVRHWLETH